MDAELAGVAHELSAAHEILAAASVSGEELAALSLFRQHSGSRTIQLNRRRTTEQQAIDRQMAVLIERRRETRLLELLRERRFAEWRSATEREAEQHAAENYLLRWNRSQ